MNHDLFKKDLRDLFHKHGIIGGLYGVAYPEEDSIGITTNTFCVKTEQDSEEALLRDYVNSELMRLTQRFMENAFLGGEMT